MDEGLKKGIEAVLNLFTRPQLFNHDDRLGVIDLDQDGIPWIEVQGEYAGCPSVDETVKSLAQKELVTHIPQIRGVEIDSGTSGKVIEEAMELFTHDTDDRTNKNHKN